jgi:hypothetical protein
MAWLITLLASISLLSTIAGVVLILTDRDLLRPDPERTRDGFRRIRQPGILWVFALLLAAIGVYLQIGFLVTSEKDILGDSLMFETPFDFAALFLMLLFLFGLGASLSVALIAIQVRFYWHEYSDTEIRRHWIGKRKLVRIQLDQPQHIRLVVTDTIDIVDGENRIVISRQCNGADRLLETLEAKGFQRYKFNQ